MIKKNKKGQLEQMESTIVLFILFFIIIMGLVFYGNVMRSRVDKMTEVFDDEFAKQVIVKIVSAPELQCTTGGLVTLDCIDIQKMSGFIEQVNSKSAYYQKEYGTVKINVSWKYAPSFNSIHETYPPPFCSNVVDCDDLMKDVTLMDFSTTISQRDHNIKVYNYPVLLGDYRTRPERYHFGWLMIEVYTASKR